MIQEFNKLKDAEVELMIKAPFLTCILIAGADGNIDKKEIKEAMTFIQQSKGTTALSEFFREISQDLEDKLKILIQSYPFQPEQRNALIVQELSQLNLVWSKLPRDFSIPFYNMLKKLAERIAASSGGLWGIKTVGSEEAEFLNLLMITDPSK